MGDRELTGASRGPWQSAFSITNIYTEATWQDNLGTQPNTHMILKRFWVVAAGLWDLPTPTDRPKL